MRVYLVYLFPPCLTGTPPTFFERLLRFYSLLTPAQAPPSRMGPFMDLIMDLMDFMDLVVNLVDLTVRNSFELLPHKKKCVSFYADFGRSRREMLP